MSAAYCIDGSGYLVSELQLDDQVNTMLRPDLLLVTPPPAQPGTVRRWLAGTWVYESDLRGQVFVRPNGQVVAITEIGQLPPDDGVDATSEEGQLRALRSVLIARAKAVREARCVQPIEVTGRVFDADLVSQTKVAGAMQKAIVSPEDWSIDWTLADNTDATLSRAEVIALGVAIVDRATAAHVAYRSVRAQIDAAQDLATVEAIGLALDQANPPGSVSLE